MSSYFCNMSYLIRPVLISEAALLTHISRSTFTEAFTPTNTPENMSAYLDAYMTEPVLASELTIPGAAFYFITLDDVVLGYLKLNTGAAQKEAMDAQSMEIERIYIGKAYWSRGLGQLLLDFSLKTALEAGMQRIWLGVWEHNERALGFYRKNGFTAFGKHPFVLGDDKQTDILMERML